MEVLSKRFFIYNKTWYKTCKSTENLIVITLTEFMGATNNRGMIYLIICSANDGVLCTPTKPCKEYKQRLSHFTMGEVNPSGACVQANSETPGLFM